MPRVVRALHRRSAEACHDATHDAATRPAPLVDGAAGSPSAAPLLTAACATNPVTGKRESRFISEAEELADRPPGGRRDSPRDGRLRRPGAAALRDRTSAMRLARVSHRPNLPWTFTVVDARPSTRSRCPADTSTSPAASCVSGRRGRARRRARPRDRPRHRAPRRAAVHAPGAGGIGLTVLSIFVPETRPRSAIWRRRASACSS